MRCVVGSTVMVRAPRSVVTVSTASYLPLTGLTMVMVPSPLELKARPESKPAPSAPEPIAGVAITFMVAISVTAIILLLHTLKRHRGSTAEREPIAGVAITFMVAISVTAIILLLHTLNSFLFLTSMARPDGPSQGASDARRVTAGLAASISTTSLEFSMLA